MVENNQLRASVEELKTLLYEARAQHFTQLDELRYYCRMMLTEAMRYHLWPVQGRGGEV